MAAVLVRSHRAASSANGFAKIVGGSSPCLAWRQSLTSSSSATGLQYDVTPPITTTWLRQISSTPWKFLGGEGKPSATDLHSLYHDQMKEIQSEREAIFGTSDDASESADLSQTARSYVEPQQSSSDPSPTPSFLPPGWNAGEEEEALKQAQAEREEIFAFSEEEKSTWINNNSGTSQIEASHMHRIREFMREAPPSQHSHEHHHGHEHEHKASTANTLEQSASPSPFTHLTAQGDGVSMVDVGNKTSSRRVAVARSVVVFPPEVMSAFQVSSTNSEMIGPKGPIFETAKIAGIMGAKKTSDLIPLCHPLPLDRVNINIQQINNQAIIECECRVTHKTGVEMEALTGATVAALTIYDMVKAVSHRVEIGQTVLVSKSGGKSDFVHN